MLSSSFSISSALNKGSVWALYLLQVIIRKTLFCILVQVHGSAFRLHSISVFYSTKKASVIRKQNKFEHITYIWNIIHIYI